MTGDKSVNKASACRDLPERTPPVTRVFTSATSPFLGMPRPIAVLLQLPTSEATDSHCLPTIADLACLGESNRKQPIHPITDFAKSDPTGRVIESQMWHWVGELTCVGREVGEARA